MERPHDGSVQHNYGSLLITQNDRGSEDEIVTAKINAKKTIDLPCPRA